ncbi:MAG: ABC transporter ATP-binding protein [Tenericutes bacterium]|nr:ABC transporter ATP-binding protein [Mycoplasmatota bacterium]
MLEVRNVTKKFIKKNKNNQSEEFLADNDISFTAREGEVVGIIGPNGAGKTTLLRMIAGIMEPTSGEVLIDSKTHQEDMIGIKKKIAFLSGNTKLYKDISPYELLEMTGSYYEVDKKTLEKRIKAIVKKFNMESFLHQKIATLSTGQYQRTSIARCLVHNPEYYILDEATSGLDVISSKSILDFIKEVKEENKCIIYSTHYMEEAENICDKIVMINKGKVIAQGTPTEICKKTKTTNLRDSFFALIGDKYE